MEDRMEPVALHHKENPRIPLSIDWVSLWSLSVK